MYTYVYTYVYIYIHIVVLCAMHETFHVSTFPRRRSALQELLRIQVPNMECYCLDFMRPPAKRGAFVKRMDHGYLNVGYFIDTVI